MTWNAFWFRPVAPRGLGTFRAIFAGAAFLHYLTVDFSGWAEVSRAFWSPGVLLAPLSAPVLPTGALQALQIFWKAFLLAAAVGLATRAALIASALGAFYLLTLRNGFVAVLHHEDGIAVFVLAILAVAHAGDAVSLDRWLARRLGRALASDEPSSEYHWPLALIQCFLSVVFLGAAAAKLRHSGLAWPGEVFPSFLLIGHYDLIYGRPLVRAGSWLYESSGVATAVGWSVLLLELGYWLALFNRVARAIVVPAAVAMLLAIRVGMGPCFVILIAAHAAWIPCTLRTQRRAP